MNKIFYSNSDYDLFRKALRSTKNEPVVINILSNDSSLIEETESQENVNVERKQMSSKFQASPFDKFFGPRKKRTDPLDMKDFSSWKNKNYRESEKEIDETPEEAPKFSFSDYLNSKAKKDKYNDEDKIKDETQKSIEQLSSEDENYKKFSLDSYLNKLEQENKARKAFETSEDLLDDNLLDNFEPTKNDEQDENFGFSSDVDIEDFTFSGNDSGDKFAFEKEELDSVRARLDKKEREANNIKEKQTTKVISADEINEIKGNDSEEDEGFNLDKLGIEDDIERVNKKINSLNKILQVSGDEETDTPKVEHKRFIEINKNFDDSEVKKTQTSEALKDKTEEESDNSEKVSQIDESQSDESKSESSTSALGVLFGDGGVVKPEKIDGAVASDDIDEIVDDAQDNFIDVVEIPESAKSDSGEMSDSQGVVSQINKTDELLTRSEFKEFSESLINKLSDMGRVEPVPQQTEIDGMYQSDEQEYEQLEPRYEPVRTGYISAQPVGQTYEAGQQTEQGYASQAGQTPVPVDTQTQYQQITQETQVMQQGGVYPQSQMSDSALQAKINELIEQNRRTDQEVAEKLQLAELEKQKVAEKYESRLRELEESMRKREEEVKQQAYLEKLRNDIKFKKSESKYKLREEKIRETEKLNSETQFANEKLKTELRNYLNVSNIEMDKKLLESLNKLHKEKFDEVVKENEELQQTVQAVEEKEKVEKPKKTTRRRTSTVSSRMRTRTPRRKIDSDIIGGINFD